MKLVFLSTLGEVRCERKSHSQHRLESDTILKLNESEPCSSEPSPAAKTSAVQRGCLVDGNTVTS